MNDSPAPIDQPTPINTDPLDQFDDDQADVLQPIEANPPLTHEEPIVIAPADATPLELAPAVVEPARPAVSASPALPVHVPLFERSDSLTSVITTRHEPLDRFDTSRSTDDATALAPADFDDEPWPQLESDRALPDLHDRTETRQGRAIWVALMFAIAAAYALTLFSFWAPADGGIDQNAYLMGGRAIADHGSTRLIPANPFQYVGGMMIVPVQGDGYFPKYPIGLPLLFAIALKLFGTAHGVAASFAISPLGAILSFVGVFYLARTVSNSFAALLAAIAFATSQVMWDLANVANSHAPCVAFVVWGMFLLIRWWQTGSIWRGILAGLLLGFAMTIRYTEGLLGLPIGLAFLFRLRWTNVRSYLRNATPLIAWLVPVATLLIYNRFTVGEWTGYDASNESTGFTLDKFYDTWEQVVRTFHDQGLFFLVPLGIVGLLTMFARNARVAIVLLAWLLPQTLLYTAYYWSPDRGVAYARFFLTLFPALIVGVAICLRNCILQQTIFVRPAPYLPHRYTPAPLTIAAGVVIGIAAGVATWRSAHGSTEGGFFPGLGNDSLPNQFLQHLALSQTGDVVRNHVRDSDLLIAEGGRGVANAPNYLQFAGNWQLFVTGSFEPHGSGFGGMFDNQDANNPNPMQPRRKQRDQQKFAGKSDRDLVAEQNRVVDAALADPKRKVFIVASRATADSYEMHYLPTKKYSFKTIDRWKMPPTPSKEEEKVTKPSMFGLRNGMGARMQRLGGPPGGPGGGPGGGGPGGPDSSVANELFLIQVLPAAPTTAPGSQPTTRP